jgi:DNA-binding FadR family transcriptional regulator
MPFQAIETQRLYQRVADQIGGLIRNGEFTAGQRLPPERDLARSLGVSRPVVREAMIALEIQGMVEVRTGSGTFVTPSVTGGLTGGAEAGPGREPRPAAFDGGPSPYELISARKLVESGIAFSAARAATPAQLDGIAEALAMMAEAVESGRNSREADRLFHTRIAEATGNAVLVSIVDGLWGSMFAPVFDALGRRMGLPEHQGMALDDHARIYEALRRQDAAAAREAMHDHLTHVEGVLLRGA